MRLRSRAICVYKYTKIDGPRFTWHVISIIAENKWHAYQRPTIAVLLLNSDSYFFLPLSSVHLFQNNQRFQSGGPTHFGKALNLILRKHAWPKNDKIVGAWGTSRKIGWDVRHAS